MLSLPAIETLVPCDADGVKVFHSTSTKLVKLDLMFEAGSAYQPKKLCASAAAKLFPVAAPAMDSAALSEFMDYRGILIETDCQVQQSMITFYFLRQYADELLPVVSSLFRGPSFSTSDFEAWKKQRRQEIMASMQKPSSVARRDFYKSLFGEGHPLGRYATDNDVDALSAEDVCKYIRERYAIDKMSVVVAGAADDALLALIARYIQAGEVYSDNRQPLPNTDIAAPISIHTPLANATQTSIRIGRILPLPWDNKDYAGIMLLATVLGGYFGSRLMSNLREEKGYTYGIYARTQLYRGLIVFYVTADVAADVASAAVDEVRKELDRLSEKPIPDDELQLVKTVMTGDFLRSVDGIFERSARYCDMYATSVTEQLTDNLRFVLSTATPQYLQSLAQKYLMSDKMIVCTAGV